MLVSANESVWTSAPKQKRKKHKTKQRNDVPRFSLTQTAAEFADPTIKNKRNYKSICKCFTRLIRRKNSLKYKTREGEKRDRNARSERKWGAAPKVQSLHHNRSFCFPRLLTALLDSIVEPQKIITWGRKKLQISRYKFLANQSSHSSCATFDRWILIAQAHLLSTGDQSIHPILVFKGNRSNSVQTISNIADNIWAESPSDDCLLHYSLKLYNPY